MYGDKGPPKKYSNPRGVTEQAVGSRVCQKCASTEHWTFECKKAPDASRKTSTRLSRSQMLRWGIKQRRQEFVPEPTEREAYTAQVREVERALLTEAREEVLQRRRLEKSRGVKDERDDDGRSCGDGAEKDAGSKRRAAATAAVKGEVHCKEERNNAEE
ncbi:uncharacterized protein Tco025E_01156 [Trypanosoma conorhini]|uniref:Zinc knuckle protein n=1 Tax=Trypanosoma conorhini TaxID=83891 RepID=A0A3R7M4S4_9TRYP|nr:uncharacterized protein Tco025E_01156 [Trypanosoma conorhini]RNF26553.1 hypothetical protein Tco025E_01156 [Trypanosoma conorhini]